MLVNWILISIFFPPNTPNLCNKGCGMYHPDCEMVHIKDYMLLRKSSPISGGSGLCLSMLHNHTDMLSALLTKMLPSFLPMCFLYHLVHFDATNKVWVSEHFNCYFMD